LVPLLVGPYIAGLLDEELYGVYNRVLAEFNIFFVLGAFGIYNYGVREISKVRENKKKREEVFSSLFVIGLISNIIVTLFYIVYFNIRGNGLDKYVYAVMIIQMMSNIFYIEFMNEAAENYAFISDTPWGDKSAYDLCINTTSTEIKSIVPVIHEYAKVWFERKEV
jgi:O-antigen/teichoic acid export membrane protein